MWPVNRKGIVGKVFTYVNGVYMTELNAEAESLIAVMNLAKQRAQAQADKLDAERLQKIRHYLEANDPRVWDLYEEFYNDSENDTREVVKTIGRDHATMSVMEFYSLANAYEEAHGTEWMERVKERLK